MLRKHINDDTVWPVPVKDDNLIGPCPCPQQGCQATDGEGPYRRGNVIIEEYGGNSGDYVTSRPCKCCDSNGRIGEGRRPYQNYCFSEHVRDVRTGYPSPYPMSLALYANPELLENIKLFSRPKEAEKKEGCYIASAVFGSSEARQVRVLRRYRDTSLLTNPVGRIFVAAYYTISPFFARHLTKSSYTTRCIRALLNHVVNKIESVANLRKTEK